MRDYPDRRSRIPRRTKRHTVEKIIGDPRRAVEEKGFRRRAAQLQLLRAAKCVLVFRCIWLDRERQ